MTVIYKNDGSGAYREQQSTEPLIFTLGTLYIWPFQNVCSCYRKFQRESSSVIKKQTPHVPYTGKWCFAALQMNIKHDIGFGTLNVQELTYNKIGRYVSKTTKILTPIEEQATSQPQDSDFNTVGEMLKAARQACNLSHAQISAAIKIRTDYLQSIENMALEDLPDKAYTIGFVRAYATHLNLPVEPLVKRFREQAAYHHHDIAPAVPAGSRQNVDLGNARQFSIIAVMLIIGFIVWCAYQIITRSQDVSQEEIISSLADYPLQRRVLSENVPFVPEVQSSAIMMLADHIDVVQENVAYIPPQLVSHVTPIYPKLCQTGAALQEEVQIIYDVDKSGRVINQRIRSSSNNCFDRVALATLSRWQYIPAKRHGRGVRAKDRQEKIVFAFTEYNNIVLR